MFRDRTTFVIGAGASKEFGLPVGTELVKLIKARSQCDLNDLDQPIRPSDSFMHAMLDRLYPDRARFQRAVSALNLIHRGLHTAVSIDAFIHRFQDDEDVVALGKLLIAIEIAQAESDSLMHPNATALNELKSETAHDTWIGSFLRILLDGVTNPSDIGKNVTIICFNYDRCIEYYLADAISSAYNIVIEDAEKIVAAMNIIHPYGTLGKLPWVQVSIDDDTLEFGPNIDLNTRWLSIAQRNIRTYTQQTHDVDATKKIHDAVGNCKVLVFLGFGFNNQNLDLLRVKEFQGEYPTSTRPVYASGKGIKSQVQDTLTRRIGNLFPEYLQQMASWKANVHIEYDKTCSELFEIHNMNMSKFTERYADHEQGTLRFVERFRDEG
ncbi:hypothetical protein [Rhizobium sp.]|uniref:hypothetical protein n=1 Tax=Rhizobium sp. TaxID=391 RepID=UPI0034C60641